MHFMLNTLKDFFYKIFYNVIFKYSRSTSIQNLFLLYSIIFPFVKISGKKNIYIYKAALFKEFQNLFVTGIVLF